jgi:hypothetical protein
LEINPHSYGHLILDNGAKTYIGEKTAPSIKGVGKVGYPHVEDQNYIHIYSVLKIHSKWNKDLKAKAETF